jgi:mono/diheme cytochrome c family protein
MKKVKILFSMLVVALTVISCSGGGTDSSTPPVTGGGGGGGGTVTNPTYTANIKSIIDGNCISCHGTGGVQSSNPFLTFAQVSARAADIKSRIEKAASDPLVMPQGGKLTQANIDLINKWITNGKPN